MHWNTTTSTSSYWSATTPPPTTLEKSQQFDDRRIRAIYWPELVSMYANHNRCVDNARGEWITFLHSDDLFPAGYLSRLFAEVQQSAGAEIVCNRHYPEEHALALELGTNDPLAVIAFTVAVNGHSPSGSAYRSDAFSRYGKFLATASFADGVLLVDWAGQGASLRLLSFQPAVWAVRPESGLRTLQLEPEHHLHAEPILNAAYCGPRGDDVRRRLVEKAPHLPARFQAALLRRHYQCGYPKEAESIWNAIGRGRNLYCQHSFYFHILPLRYLSWLYWPVILNGRKIKRAFLRRLKKA